MDFKNLRIEKIGDLILLEEFVRSDTQMEDV